MTSSTLGDQEHLVLRTVAKLGRCSVRQVFLAVGEPRGLAYTTIATVLDRLFAKGLLTREMQGKAFSYRVTRKIAAAERGRMRTLIAKLFRSEPAPAMASLVDAVEAVDPVLLDELAAEVERRRSRRGS